MCGRVIQKRNINDYLEKIIRAPTPEEIFRADLVGPATTFHQEHAPGDSLLRKTGFVFRMIFCSYTPARWKRQPSSNARLETIAAAKWPWQRLMREHGRVIVPVDGWYEVAFGRS
ncbi:SOS response-associated peptidase family protein [Bordetella sp. LUAb4]|uniref:SOS response-associated peptidase family protein n=1 Tax=Bordetella sp. LUAb4 TaxID=2843195 RepID=UPI001E39E7CE|nr:SOS response-associated peptidase family protein [Bordetella sp. LUAb4]